MKSLTLSIAMLAATVTLSPVAHAGMLVGNYEMLQQRDPGHSWLWAVRPCQIGPPNSCVHVQGIPRPNGQAVPYDGDAPLANGRYTMIINSPDGVRCGSTFLPSRDTYSWDAASLTGAVDSVFDAGCGGAPGGSANYPFSLVRNG